MSACQRIPSTEWVTNKARYHNRKNPNFPPVFRKVTLPLVLHKYWCFHCDNGIQSMHFVCSDSSSDGCKTIRWRVIEHFVGSQVSGIRKGWAASTEYFSLGQVFVFWCKHTRYRKYSVNVALHNGWNRSELFSESFVYSCWGKVFKYLTLKGLLERTMFASFQYKAPNSIQLNYIINKHLAFVVFILFTNGVDNVGVEIFSKSYSLNILPFPNQIAFASTIPQTTATFVCLLFRWQFCY